MLKSLFATCLTALSVNTQPLAVPPSLEPSCATSESSSFNVGDIYNFTYTMSFTDNISISLFNRSNTDINALKLLSYSFSDYVPFSFIGFIPYTFTSCTIYLGYVISDFNLDYQFILNCDYQGDSQTFIKVFLDNNFSPFQVSFTFEVLEGFEGFSNEALPYLTKVEKPYTPPAKSNLYRLLYDFYYSIFNDDDLTAITTGYNMPFDNWLAHTCTIATLLTLIVVAFFFLRWLFRVISGLVLLKR